MELLDKAAAASCVLSFSASHSHSAMKEQLRKKEVKKKGVVACASRGVSKNLAVRACEARCFHAPCSVC